MNKPLILLFLFSQFFSCQEKSFDYKILQYEGTDSLNTKIVKEVHFNSDSLVIYEEYRGYKSDDANSTSDVNTTNYYNDTLLVKTVKYHPNLKGICCDSSKMEFFYNDKNLLIKRTAYDYKRVIKKIEKENHVRLYTLNYDRIFKILLEDIGIKCFEGFEVTGEISDSNGLRANVPRIINDFSTNTHYNLHGCSFWKVIALNNRQLQIPEFVYRGIPDLPINDRQANVQMEKGKPIYLTSIITGYQKAQKTIITPFKQMSSAFDKDCCNTNKITIVGYSFGDEHINESIKTALRFNENVILEIISPNFINKKMDLKLLLSLFQFFDKKDLLPNKVSDNKFSYFNGRVIVYTLGFIEYLELVTSSS